MGNLVKKLILPLAFSFLSIFNAKTPISEKIDISEFYKTKKEHYEKRIKETFSNLNKIIYTNSVEKHGWNKWQTIEETLLLNAGNCIDKSIYEWNQLNKLEIPTKLVMGSLTDSSENYHVWLEAIIGRDTLIIECSKFPRIFLRDTLSRNCYIPLKLDNTSEAKIKKLEKGLQMKLNIRNYKQPSTQQHSFP